MLRFYFFCRIDVSFNKKKMTIDKQLEFFVYYILPLLIFVFGLVGNGFCWFILRNQNDEIRIGSNFLYKCILIVDSVNLLSLLSIYSTNGFDKDLTAYSRLFCKMFTYLNFTLAPVSAMLLAFNSALKLFRVRKYEAALTLFRQERFQLFYFLLVLLANSLYYLPVLFIFDIHSNQDEVECGFVDSKGQTVISAMDFVNRVVIPLCLLSVCTVYLVNSVNNLKSDIKNRNFTERSENWLRIQVDSLGTLICLNINYMILNTPINTILLFTKIGLESITFSFTVYLHYVCFGVSFYVMFMSHPVFRKLTIQFLRSNRNEYEEAIERNWKSSNYKFIFVINIFNLYRFPFICRNFKNFYFSLEYMFNIIF